LSIEKERLGIYAFFYLFSQGAQMLANATATNEHIAEYLGYPVQVF
jgi:hypothetical protein